MVDGGVELDGDADGADLAGLDNNRGFAVLAEGFEGEDFGATVSAAEGGEEVAGDGLAPLSMACGEVVLILGEDFAVIAAGVKPTFVNPPDFVGQGGDEIEFMGGNQYDGALSAEALETDGGAGTDEGVAGGKCMIERENGDGTQVERFGRGQIAAAAQGQDLSRVGEDGCAGKLKDLSLAAAVFPDKGNNRAVGGGGGKLVERRQGGFAEVNGHRT